MKKNLSYILFLFTFAASAENYQIKIYDKTLDLVNKNFYDQTFRGLDWPHLVQKFRSNITATTSDQDLENNINGLLSFLNASHTEFLSTSDQEYWALKSIFSGHIKGAPIKQIGAWFTKINEKWFIKNIFNNSPAEKAGLLPGDEIIEADGKPFQPIVSFYSKSNLVSLLIKRTTKQEPFIVTLKPIYKSFQSTLLDATKKSYKVFQFKQTKVAYFHLWSGTHEKFKQALKLAAQKAVKDADYFILDLRDGFGGADPEYLAPFSANSIYNKPLIVLINDGVRSGKEWIAYILKNSKRATLIGSKTKGYFLSGRTFEIKPNQFMLYLAVKEDLALPKIEGLGVVPDLKVSFDLPYSQGNDPVLEAAIQYVKSI